MIKKILDIKYNKKKNKMEKLKKFFLLFSAVANC